MANQFMETHTVKECYVFLIEDVIGQAVAVDRVFTDEEEAKGYHDRNHDFGERNPGLRLRRMGAAPLILPK